CLPTEHFARVRGVADQQLHLGRTVELRVHLYHHLAGVSADTGFTLIFALPLQADPHGLERQRREVAHRLGAAGREYERVGLVRLQHAPHGFDVFFGKTPVALSIEVAKLQTFLLPELDPRHRIGDLAGDELAPAQRRLVVEQDAAGTEDPEGFAVVHRAPVREQLGHAIRAAWPEHGVFVLRHRLHLAEYLRRGRLVETRVGLDRADRVQQVQRPEAGDL